MGIPHVEVPDRAAGYSLAETDWDSIRDPLNSGTWVQLGDVITTGTPSSVSFTSIPATYMALKLVMFAKHTGSTSGLIRFNSDTGNNYDVQWLDSVAAVISATTSYGASSIQVPFVSGPGVADAFGSAFVVIPNYASTVGNKVAYARWSRKDVAVSTGLVSSRLAGFWRSNAAISTVTFTHNGGTGLVNGSRFTLYGLA